MKLAVPIFLAVALTLAASPFAKGQEEHRAIVVPVSFQDCAISVSTSRLDSLLVRLSDYYNAQFLGRKNFIFNLGPTAVLENSFSYYGANTFDKRDAKAEEMARAACSQINSQVDFSIYDNSADGNVNDIIFVVAGMNEVAAQDQNRFWPQYITTDGKFTIDRKTLSGFAVVTEYSTRDSTLTGIGHYAHEFGHILGLKDMYDTDGDSSGGYCRGLQCTSLMDLGMNNDSLNTPPNLNAIERDMLGAGWCEIIDDTGDFTLEPIHQQGHYCLLPCKEEGRFYLLENRIAEGYDRHIGGEGMLVYKIDKSAKEAGYSTYFQRTLTALERWKENQVNCNPEYPCANLLRAVDDPEDFSKVFWPQEGADSFSHGPVSVTKIKRLPGGNISFKVVEPVKINAVTVFQSSAIVIWTISPDLGPVDSVKLVWSNNGVPVGSSHGKSLGSGRFSHIIKGLSPRTEYSVTASAYLSGGTIYSATDSFVTRIHREGIFRFIYLADVPRNPDGSFPPGTKIPLEVYNSVNEDVTWTFNGSPVSVGEDGLWAIPGSGILKAEVTTSNGSTEIIVKELMVR